MNAAPPAEVEIDTKSDLRADALAEKIKNAVNTWPPLSAEERAQLAVLLNGDSQ
jgi:hypothetical protein